MYTYDKLKNELDWHSRDWQTINVVAASHSYPAVRFKLESDDVPLLGGRIRTETTIVDSRAYGELGDRLVKVYKGKNNLLVTAAVENCGWGTEKVFKLMRLFGFNA